MYLGFAVSLVTGQQVTGVPALPGTPVFTVWPALSPVTVPVGETVALSLGVATGVPAPVLSYRLLLDGVDVTTEVSDGAFVPDVPGVLNLEVTATNSVAASRVMADGLVAPAAASVWNINAADGQISILSAPAVPAPVPVSASGLVILMGAAA